MTNRPLGVAGPSVSALGLAAWACRSSTAPPTRREHRHDPGRARRRDHAARHRRLLRDGSQRAAAARGAARPRPRRGRGERQVRAAARIRAAAIVGDDLRPPRSRTSSPTRCAGSARITSTSTGRAASIPPCRSRRRSARSPRWSRPATSATSASPRPAPRRCAARTPSTRSADLQIEYSLLSRAIETEILPTCRELGVGVTAYGVLSRGLLSGHWSKERGAPARRRLPRHAPRFSGENLDRNLALVEDSVRRGAEGATVAQVAIAWVLSRGERHRAARRGPNARAARRGARRPRPRAHRRGSGRDRGGRSGRRGRGRAVRRTSRWRFSTASGAESGAMATGR